MKNYSIIEDLDFDQLENLCKKSLSEKLNEQLLRNYFLIRRYSDQEDQIFFTRFKRRVIPKYLQQLYEYCHEIQLKNQRLVLSKRKLVLQNSISPRKNRKSSPQIINQKFPEQEKRIQQNKEQKFQKEIQIQELQEQENISNLKEKSLNCLSSQSKLKEVIQVNDRQNSLKRSVICPSITNKAIHSRKQSQIQNISAQAKVYASIYNDSINFSKKYFFQTTLNQISRTRQQKQFQQSKNQFYNLRNSLDEKNLQRKMINILKQRKSNKNYKMKIFSNYTHSKNSEKQLSDKQNYLKRRPQGQKDFIKQANQKVNLLNLNLKGKICLPIKHRLTNSCNIQKGFILDSRRDQISLKSLDKNYEMAKNNTSVSNLNTTISNLNITVANLKNTLSNSNLASYKQNSQTKEQAYTISKSGNSAGINKFILTKSKNFFLSNFS